MPEWAMQLIAMILGSTTITGGIGIWYKNRREDRIRNDVIRQEAQLRHESKMQAEVDALKTKVEEQQERFINVLTDAKAKAEEDAEERAERMALDIKMVEFIAANTSALKESTSLIARLKKDA